MGVMDGACCYHLRGALLGAAEAADHQVAVLKHQVSRSRVMEVQVSQDVTVMVQHGGSECRADTGAALLTLSAAGCPSGQRQVGGDLTPADSTDPAVGTCTGGVERRR